MSRLDEIEARLNRQRRVGTTQQSDDLADLVKFAREVVEALDAWVSDPASPGDARSRAIERIDRATELIGEDWKP